MNSQLPLLLPTLSPPLLLLVLVVLSAAPLVPLAAEGVEVDVDVDVPCCCDAVAMAAARDVWSLTMLCITLSRSSVNSATCTCKGGWLPGASVDGAAHVPAGA